MKVEAHATRHIVDPALWKAVPRLVVVNLGASLILGLLLFALNAVLTHRAEPQLLHHRALPGHDERAAAQRPLVQPRDL